MTEQNVPMKIEGLLGRADIRKRFDDMLGKKAAGFLSSVLSAVNQNPDLKNADPMSIMSAAAIAASLDLPINPNLGYAHIIPYSGKAQMQMGWKGFVQLAQRSGQYQTINVAIVYEGELVSHNKFTGEMQFDQNAKKSDKIIGYMGYIRLSNRYEKYYFMSLDEMRAHGKRYSKSFDNKNSRWQQDFDTMALKTVLKLLLSKWGILSIDMQVAIHADQAVIKETGDYEYPDNPTNVTEIEASASEPEIDQEAVTKFEALMIEKKVDLTILNQFLEKTAEANQMTVDQVKVEALSEIGPFFSQFAKWEEMAKGKEKPKGKSLFGLDHK